MWKKHDELSKYMHWDYANMLLYNNITMIACNLLVESYLR